MAKKISALIGHEGLTQRVEYEVPQDEPGFWGADHDFSVAGKKRVRRPESIEVVTGKAKYTHDINRPNMLYAALVTCPYAHAKVLNVDTSKAEKMPGVKAVMVADRLETARFAGWIIAAVAAETIQQARDAARMVNVEYQELPFVIDMDEAMTDQSLLSGEKGEPKKSTTRERGDPEKGFREADVIHEGEYETPVNTHSVLETHGCVAEFEGDELTVWFSTQALWGVQRPMAQAGEVPVSKTRIITQYMGGGFGSKLGSEQFAEMGVKLAKQTGRPVKFMVNRYEDTVMCGNKPGARMAVKLGAKRDGTLTAVSTTAHNLVGHSGGGSVAPAFSEFYECPNVLVKEASVRIHAGSARPFRAPGHPQSSFGMEMALEELAVKLAMDPVELRLKNLPTIPLNACAYELKLGAERFGWKNKFKQHGSDTRVIRSGVGCAVTYWPCYASPGGAVVRCNIHSDGSVEVANAAQDLGTGTRTMMAVTAAETLGIDVESVRVSTGDTRIGLPGPTSGGSTTTPTVSPAVQSAAYKAKRKLFEFVARKWEISPDDMDCKDGVVFHKSDPSKKMTWKEAASLIRRSPIIATAENIEPPKIEGMRIGTPSRGAQFAEVEVDTETGKVRCKKIVAVQDCGKAIAKAQAESQITGGVIQGVSFALLENRIMDTVTGRQINPNMEDYKIINAMDVPEIETIIVDVFDPVSSTSAKGLGEPPHIPTAAAIGCAVYNALGVPIRSLPITPDKILEALGRQEG
jgi:xanthine dehydrogenase YagR molybdenum-binding subunit